MAIVRKNPYFPSGRTVASEKVAGFVQLATNAQASAGTRTDRVVTAYQLATYATTNFPVATTSVEGKTELATDAEAQARSSSAAKALVPANLAADGFLQWIDVSLSNAEIKALTTPKELVAAPGAGKVIYFRGAVLKLVYGGNNAFTESGDNMAIRYTDGSGVIVSQTIESTGFIDATADTYTNAEPKIDGIVAATGAENQALVLDNTGSNFSGNAAADNTMEVRVFYTVMAI